MRVVLTLLVRDEADIVRANIEHHLARGVDAIVATDNGSVDGTREILLEYRQRGLLLLIDEPARDYDQWRWVTRMARLAATELSADWVLHGDADEFWTTDGDTIGDVLATVPDECGWVRVRRFNFAPSAHDDRPFFERLVLRDQVSRNALGRSLLPKICHRPDADVWLAQGNHEIHTRWTEYHEPLPLRILHFPMRSYVQFERKVVLGGRAYARNGDLEPEIGDAWRRLYQVYLRGELRGWYDRQIPTAATVTRGIATGHYVVDRTIDDFCRAAGLDGSSVPPRLGPMRRARRSARCEDAAAEGDAAAIEVLAQSRRAGVDGGLEAELVDFIDGARESIACAAFDLQATAVVAALHEAEERGVDVRVRVDMSTVWPHGHGCDPKRGDSVSVLREWRLPALTAYGGVMHHKFVVRDGYETWTGSANFTRESLHNEDNDCVIVRSRAIAAAFLAVFDDPSHPRAARATLPDGEVAAVFAPGDAIRSGIMSALTHATRVRVLAHGLEDPGLLSALRLRRDAGADVAGAYDAETMAALLAAERRDPRQFWFLADERFAAARGDVLHNRLVIADETVITGSANLATASSRYAENALVIRSPSIASSYREYAAAVIGACRREAYE
jgi:phosphatidylserine/phosphatidylglycerophosphate/cardiolipin synthase-like enzyme